MTKKILLVLAIVLSFTTSLVFATTNDMVSNAGNSVKNVVSDVGNGIKNGAEDIKDGIKDMGNGVSNMMTTDKNTDNMSNERTMSTNNNGYTATRTASTTNTDSSNTLTWTWFIIAVATILIVGLVWYYGTQYDTTSNRSEH